jgi:hypothetical protein
MSIFGRKFDRGVTRFASKVKHADIKTFASKVAHGVHSGLNIADKVLSTVSKVSNYVGKVGGALGSAGVPGAGLLSLGAKSIGGLAKTADKGVKGLEKATSKVEHLGDTINRARGNIVSSGYNPSIIGSEAKRVMDANPLKR